MAATIIPFDGVRPPIDEPVLEFQIETKPEVRFLGQAALLDTRSSSDGDIRRQHQLQHWEVDGYNHTVWYTEPANGIQPVFTAVAKPGLGEAIEDGVGWGFHSELARQLPNARVISHATHGVGNAADRISLKNLTRHGINHMAEQGLELLKKVDDRSPVVFVGTSMGTVIGNRLLNLNIEQGNPVNIAGVVYYAPALVDPRNVGRDMAIQFMPDLLKDGARELLFRTDPRYWLGVFSMLLASRPSLKDIPPMVRHSIDLLHGTPEVEIQTVVDHYPTLVIAGTRDSVGQIKMWRRLEQFHPNLVLEAVHHRGHAMTLNPRAGVSKIVSSLPEIGIFPND